MCDWSCSDDLRATPQIAVLDSMEAPKLGIADGQIPPEYAELYSA